MTIELFEVEDRAVAIVLMEGNDEAFAWSAGAWRSAPGLLGKAYLEGSRLTQAEFAAQFPQVQLDDLKPKAST